MSSFAVTLEHGPSWDGSRGIREQDGWDEHAVFMDSLGTDGFLLLGGPVDGGRRTLHAVEAADEAEVRRRFAADPWARHGLLVLGEVRPWEWWLDLRTDAGSGRSSKVS